MVTLGQAKKVETVQPTPTAKAGANTTAAKSAAPNKGTTKTTSKKRVTHADVNVNLPAAAPAAVAAPTTIIIEDTSPAGILRLADQMCINASLKAGSVYDYRLSLESEDQQALNALKFAAELLMTRYTTGVSVAGYSRSVKPGLSKMESAWLYSAKIDQLIKIASSKTENRGRNAAKLVQTSYPKDNFSQPGHGDLDKDSLNISLYKRLSLLAEGYANPLTDAMKAGLKESLGDNLGQLDEAGMLAKVRSYIDSINADPATNDEQKAKKQNDQKNVLLAIGMTVEAMVTRYLINIRAAADYYAKHAGQKGAYKAAKAMLAAKPLAQMQTLKNFGLLQARYLKIEAGLKDPQANASMFTYSEKDIYDAMKALCGTLPDIQRNELMPFFEHGPNPDEAASVRNFDEQTFWAHLIKVKPMPAPQQKPAEAEVKQEPPKPPIPIPEPVKEQVRLGDGEMFFTTGMMDGAFNAGGGFKYTPIPHLHISAAADRFSKEMDISGDGQLLNKYLYVEGKYGASRNEDLNTSIDDPITVHTVSAKAEVKVIEQLSLNVEGSASGLLTNGFSVPSRTSDANFAEANLKAGMIFHASLTNKKLIKANIAYGRAYVNSSLISDADNGRIVKQFIDMGADITPKDAEDGLYGGMGYRFLLDKEISSLHYPLLYQDQSSIYGKFGYRFKSYDFGVGARYNYMSKAASVDFTITFGGKLPGIYVEKAESQKPAEQKQTAAASTTVSAQPAAAAPAKELPKATPQPAAAAPLPAKELQKTTLQPVAPAPTPADTSKKVVAQPKVSVQVTTETTTVQQTPAAAPAAPQPAVVLQPAAPATPPAPAQPQAPARPLRPRLNPVFTNGTSPLPLPLANVRDQGLANDLLVKKFHKSPAEFADIAFDEAKFQPYVKHYKVYLALKLLGRNPDLGDKEPLIQWMKELRKCAMGDLDNLGTWNLPNMPANGPANLGLYLQKYVDLNAFLNKGDLEMLHNKKYKDWSSKKYHDAIDRYTNVLKAFDNNNTSVAQDMFSVRTGNDYNPSVEDCIKFLSNAWTENVGNAWWTADGEKPGPDDPPRPAGIMSGKVVLYNKEAIGQLIYTDNVCKTLRGEMDVQYDASTKTGKFVNINQ